MTATAESVHHDEKLSATHVAAVVDETNQPRYDDKEVKAMLRKVDWRLMPILTYLYLVSYLDRGNIGNAKVAGMNVDLNLTGAQYNFALTVRLIPEQSGRTNCAGILYSLCFIRNTQQCCAEDREAITVDWDNSNVVGCGELRTPHCEADTDDR